MIASAPAGPGQGSRERRGERLDELLQLGVLSAFAFAQPLFAVLADHATFLVAHHARPGDLVGLALVVALAPPLAWWALESLVGLAGRGARRAVHGLGLAACFAALVLGPLFRAEVLPDALAVSLVLSVAGLGALAMLRWPPAAAFARVLSPAPLVFAALFLADDDVRKLVLPTGGSWAGGPGGDGRADLGSGPAGRDLPSVLLLVVDEFPTATLLDEDHRVDARLFPNFARLAADATWFRNASTVHDHTREALPAIFTGRYPEPDDERMPLAADHPENLLSLLEGTHRLVVHETMTALAPPSAIAVAPGRDTAERLRTLAADTGLVWAHVVVPEPLSAGWPRVDLGWRDFGGGTFGGGAGGDPVDLAALDESARRAHFTASKNSSTELFRAFVAAIDDVDTPTAWVHHTLLPHQPWTRLDTGQAYTRSWDVPGRPRSAWEGTAWSSDYGFQRHLIQACHLDELLGELLDTLEALDLYDDLMIVVVGDHGISFRPGLEHRRATAENVEDILYVPLIVKRPGRGRAAISDRNVETIDVLPTVADALGLALPYPVDGRSAFGDAPGRPHKRLHRREADALEVPAAPPARWALRERKVRLFGPSPGRSDLYAMGAWRSLVGRAIPASARRPSRGVSAAVSGDHRYRDVDPDADVLPCQVVGTLVAPTAAELPRDLAVEVNGRIAAVTRPIQVTGPMAGFSALVPATSLRAGANEIVVHALSGTPEDPVFVSLTPAHPTLEGDRLVFPGGTVLPVKVPPSGAYGRLNRVRSQDKGTLDLSGWASQGPRPGGAIPPDGLLVFEDGRFVYHGGTDTTGPGEPVIVYPPEEGKEPLGFRLSVPLDLFEGAPAGRLSLVSVCGDVAYRLPASANARWVLAPRR